MAEKPPYVTAYGTIAKVLQKMQEAATPPRFTQDFLATKLGLKGGSPKPIIPFLKRTGFLGSDGVPTEIYKRFRNSGERGKAAAEALKKGYSSLYEINEYVHDASAKDLKGVVVQVTGLEPNSGTVKAILGSFKALKALANFSDAGAADDTDHEVPDSQDAKPKEEDEAHRATLRKGLGLSYTINLNLPSTSDITVFDAIFRSLKDHLLK